jgi:signal transduction histidine kinase
VGELVVRADPDGISRVLNNFLDNAAKFSPPGSPIRVEARAENGDVVIRVIDHGPGIPDDEQDQLFEFFYQASPKATGRSGSGLGLAIARRYAELQHGRVWVESKVGEGSTFVVAVPQA